MYETVKRKTVAIIQSSYIPWKGYFDIINEVDIFVFLDTVEYSKGSWRNRNLIKTPSGPKWLTVPVQKKGLNKLRIDQVSLSNNTWQLEHLSKLENSYRSAPYWNHYRPLLADLYETQEWGNLSKMNQLFTRRIAKELDICSTDIINAGDLNLAECSDSTSRLINILTCLDADTYISGPSAKNYLDTGLLKAAGLTTVWKEYKYPDYPQLYPPFEHGVSVLDLLFNIGPGAGGYIWG